MAKDAEVTSERRCILSREVHPKTAMIRLVKAPDGAIIPDVAEKLPGRGYWVRCDGSALRVAQAKGPLLKALSAAVKAKVTADQLAPDLCSQIERLLKKRILDRLGLEKRAGHLVTGFDKIKEATAGKKAVHPVAALISASDSGEDGRTKMRYAVGTDIPVFSCLNRDELSQALGRDNAVHVLVYKSGGATILATDLYRLQEICG